MGTILGILFIVAVILGAGDFLKEGSDSINSGTGCGCIFGIILILFALGLLSMAFSAPVGMIIIALAIVFFAGKK